MSQQLEREVLDIAKWYFEHRDDGRSIDKEIAFMKTTIDNLLHCLATATHDIRKAEGRDSGLILPGMGR